jgi:tetrathionate reductase subunit B
MVVDLRLCVGCQACAVACGTENRTPLGNFRTSVSCYEVSGKNGKTRRYNLPRLCNHCDKPACVTVCPTQATFKLADGTVVVDNSVCVGCGYCIQACPYEARFINSQTKTTDKCSYCHHRLDAGLLPACVETCVTGARVFGDLNDPHSAVAQLVSNNPVQVLKKAQGTSPKLYYIGLDQAFSGKIDGRAVIKPSQAATKEES